IELRLAYVVRLFVFALFDEDAFWGTLFFADLTTHAAETGVWVIAVVDEKGEVARGLSLRQSLLGELNGRQPFLADKAAEEVPGSLCQTFQDAFTEHCSRSYGNLFDSSRLRWSL
ncbi:MAG TPA: hypothetical protein VF214_00170, partial [Edaphobacter sp.]